MNTTEKLPRPTVDYPGLFGKLTGLISMYEIGITSRAEFLKKAKAVEADYDKQCEVMNRFLDLPIDERINNYQNFN